MRTSLLLRFLIWSMLIFAVSVGLMSFRVLRNLELKTASLALPLRYSFGGKLPLKPDIPVVSLSLWGQGSYEMYLRHASEIAQKLKSAGAKVLLVPLPSDLLPVPRILTMLNRISREGNVVFGASTETRSPYSSRSRLFPESSKNWWVRHPTLHRVNLSWGIISVRREPFSALFRFVPNEYRDFDTGETVPDVSLQALKRYFGLPDSYEIHHTPYYEFFDRYAIPLERDGFAYVKYSFNPAPNGGVYAIIEPQTDSLSFFPIRSTAKRESFKVDSAWSYYRDKLVVLDWYGISGYEYPSLGPTYVQIIDAILNRDFVDRNNDYDLFFIILIVVLLSVVGYHLRGAVTVAISLLLGAGILVLSVWLLDRYSVLFDPVYLLVPTLLCGIILPIVKLVEDKRMLIERVKGLEEEKRRLEEVTRRQTPSF